MKTKNTDGLKTVRIPPQDFYIKANLVNREIYIILLADNNSDTNLAIHYQASKHKLGVNNFTRWVLNG